MVEVMKIMVTSFKRSPNHATGHRRPRPMPETPDKASLGQSLVESLSLSSGSWCTQSFFCALPESVSPVLLSSGSSMVVIMATSSKRAYVIPRS